MSGESGLARFFKLPPVDVKKIADIVKYEARQQIPFALEDVIWDYQRMAGGQEVDGFALDTEIGLFAMKREQVAKALAPYKTAEHRGRHHPARADRDLQLRRLRRGEGAAGGRGIQPGEPAAVDWSCCRSAPTRPTWW